MSFYFEASFTNDNDSGSYDAHSYGKQSNYSAKAHGGIPSTPSFTDHTGRILVNVIGHIFIRYD